MKFTPNVPIELTEPTVAVDAGLAPGRHRFRLVVIGTSGLKSKPVEFTVVVDARVPILPPLVPGPIPPPMTPR